MVDNEIVLYQPNDTIHLEVRMANDTVWLTQSQIAMLFNVGRPVISKHLKNIFRSGELDEKTAYSILEYTATDGKVYPTKFYNLDAILSIGYRVNSIQVFDAYTFVCNLTRSAKNKLSCLTTMWMTKKWFAFSKMDIETETLIKKM